ncbi:pentapeptide repeat-containing protein [Phormidium sp. LEGE 05292]|uniref:pentapeptide repeat-containing protein n=1 Tax=[Phormidium] sp. LEGE 05292 TaxID=767427 RepID=UPI0018820719|nr:pentapeptide repeat-containing protein [Phormidium sp. LEGE 05292]MBE9226269.1 pentapeptide repeat-containing protein [Phormidium sp. LEGE 05292]
MTKQPDSFSNQPVSISPVDSPNGSNSQATQVERTHSEADSLLYKPYTNLPAITSGKTENWTPPPTSALVVIIMAIALMFAGLIIHNFWVGISGSIVALLLSIRLLWSPLKNWLNQFLPQKERIVLFLGVCGILAIAGLLNYLGVYHYIGAWFSTVNWEASGALAEWCGALGQISIAVLAVYVAWQQYVISRDLTIEQNRLTNQQNLITQQQTIDAYFQGVSDLALGEEGLLEDWPQERIFAEGRTAALLSSIDATGKAKVLRFLSRSRLLTPLRRDQHLGRPILDGMGGYQEDRQNGLRVIDLGVMLAGADLSGTDLRWTDLSDANLVRANLNGCDLVHANFTRTILFEANLSGADLKGVKFFYGKLETASPRSRSLIPDFQTGAYTGAVVEDADFTNVHRLSEEQRYYCCAWGGEKTRSTISGGCRDIPNLLGR